MVILSHFILSPSLLPGAFAPSPSPSPPYPSGKKIIIFCPRRSYRSISRIQSDSQCRGRTRRQYRLTVDLEVILGYSRGVCRVRDSRKKLLQRVWRCGQGNRGENATTMFLSGHSAQSMDVTSATDSASHGSAYSAPTVLIRITVPLQC